MDPLTHLLTTAALVDTRRDVLAVALVPDLPWYLLYPAWLLCQRKARAGNLTDWPMPPDWIRSVHYATHSLVSLGVLYVAAQLCGRRRGRWGLAWLLHVLIDIPSHSRKRMAPRPFWPLSDWAFDGISWADWLSRQIRVLANRRRVAGPQARPLEPLVQPYPMKDDRPQS